MGGGLVARYLLEFGISPFVIVRCSDSPDYPCRRHLIQRRSPALTVPANTSIQIPSSPFLRCIENTCSIFLGPV
ncbi:hypothetical protein BDR07DRAFT_1388788 [Suillus spraguei]|nr:hypothetical protein BDR07DRAFT_1388788 [Suillus spraguei]